MFSTLSNGYRRIIGVAVAATVLLGTMLNALAEEKLADPIYRVANETPAAQTPAATESPAPAGAAAAPQAAPPAATAPAKAVFDLTRKPVNSAPGAALEHQLAPVLRILKATQEEIDRNVHDYSCTLVKHERVDGELGETQHILLKVRHEPFSVYMSFLKPYAGREVLYVAGQNKGEMVVLEAGFKRVLGKMNLDPQGTLAMSGQKHPITDVGMRNLTAKLTKMWETEMKFEECDVTTNPGTKIDGRSATMVQIVHPIPRQNFRFHVARLFFDNELKTPIHFDAFLWPEKEGEEPPLDESYTYTNLKLNNGFTARDFDATNNPDIFK